MDNEPADGLPYIEGSLFYLAATVGESEATDLSEAKPEAAGWPGRSRRYTVAVRNGRLIFKELSLDAQGFVLLRKQTAVVNFYDEQEVRTVYYPEVERLLKGATGAIKIVVFAHDVRSILKAGKGEKGVREPVAAVHNDYTIKSGPEHVRELLKSDEAEERLKNRFVEINIWRPIRGPVQSTPLAVCDSRSIAQEDLVPTDLKHEVYMVRFSPSIAGSTFRTWRLMRYCSSRVSIRWRTGGRGSQPTPHLRIPGPPPLPQRERASRLVPWFSTDRNQTPKRIAVHLATGLLQAQFRS
jgi:hypothetical protein